jgi:hypothetical protein
LSAQGTLAAQAGMDAGYKKFMSFCKAKTQSQKTAGMPFFGSARDACG